LNIWAAKSFSGSFYQSGKWQKCEKVLNPHQIGLLLLLRQIMLSGKFENIFFFLQFQKCQNAID